MSTTIQISKKEIKLKDSNIIIEDEVFPSTIYFDLKDYEDVTNIDSLTWIVQYYRGSSDNGFDVLTKTSSSDSFLLEWKVSAGFTKNKGKTKLQVIGIKTATTGYEIRWSTKIATIDLPENLLITAVSPLITPDWLSQFIVQMEDFAERAEEACYEIENMTVSSESIACTETATATKTISPAGVVNIHFGIPKGEPGVGSVEDVTDEGVSIVDNRVAKIVGHEKTSNKISSWQATPDNSHYPTEKLVKDSMDLIKFKVSVLGDVLKIEAPSTYVSGETLVIGSLA